jgi:hypothetical protein
VAVTGSILRHYFKSSISHLDSALCELFTGAFFFAMHSCEYLQVTGQCKTKILVLRNVRFFIGNKNIPLQISSYDSSTPETTVNTYIFDDGSKLLFIGTHLLKKLRLAVTAIGLDTLGFSTKQIGLHSA